MFLYYIMFHEIHLLAIEYEFVFRELAQLLYTEIQWNAAVCLPAIFFTITPSLGAEPPLA